MGEAEYVWILLWSPWVRLVRRLDACCDVTDLVYLVQNMWPWNWVYMDNVLELVEIQ